MSEPNEAVKWNKIQGEGTTLDFFIAVPVLEVMKAVASGGGTISRTFNVEGQRFDVSIMPLGEAQDAPETDNVR